MAARVIAMSNEAEAFCGCDEWTHSILRQSDEKKCPPWRCAQRMHSVVSGSFNQPDQCRRISVSEGRANPERQAVIAQQMRAYRFGARPCRSEWLVDLGVSRRLLPPRIARRKTRVNALMWGRDGEGGLVFGLTHEFRNRRSEDLRSIRAKQILGACERPVLGDHAQQAQCRLDRICGIDPTESACAACIAADRNMPSRTIHAQPYVGRN